MKYIIVAKNIFVGDSKSDEANPLKVTEIATELIITRLMTIDMLQTGKICSADCIVTQKERACLYTNIFDNVIDYTEFLKLSIPKDNVIDLLQNDIFDKMSSGDMEKRVIPYKPFYRNFERDKHLLLNFEHGNKEKYDTSDPFVVLVIRTRGAWPEKNMTDGFWKQVIDELKERNIKIFVFGRETECFSGDGVSYIENFQDWCTISEDKNCRNVISTASGGVYPCLIFGNKNTVLTIIDNLNIVEEHKGDPSFYDDCINFSKIKIDFIKKIPAAKDLCEIIKNNISTK
jgi:hypothetical protein